jgi:hypothetical protein
MPGRFTYYANIEEMSFTPTEGEEITAEEAATVARLLQAKAASDLARHVERIADYIDQHGFTDRFAED